MINRNFVYILFFILNKVIKDELRRLLYLYLENCLFFNVKLYCVCILFSCMLIL